MAERELTEAEKKWIDRWVEGISSFIARSPHESREEYLREKETVKKILMEKKEELPEFAHRWRTRLLEALGVSE